MVSATDSTASLEVIAHPHLVDLSEELDEAACFSIVSGDDTITVDQVDAPKPIQAENWTGTRVPMHAGSAGIVVMATWDDREIDRYLAGNDSEDELIAAWQFDSERPEFTWLSVVVTKGQQLRKWDVIDEGMNGWSSMARTTGLVTVEVAEMLADGTISDFGVMPPERLGEERPLLDRVVQSMRLEGVQIVSSIDL